MMASKAQPMLWLTTLALFVYPVLALTVHNAGNAIFYLLLMLSVAGLVLRAQHHAVEFGLLFKRYWPLYLAMISACLAVFFNQLWSGNLSFKFYDRSLRLALFPLIFWVLFFVPLRYMKCLHWSFFAAAIVAAIKAYMLTHGGTVREGNIGFLSIIAYSDIALLSGILCVTSSGGYQHKSKPIFLLMLLGCLIGAYVSILTATRGSWVAVPLLIIFFFAVSELNMPHKLLWSSSAVVVLICMLSFNHEAQQRLYHTQDDLLHYSQEQGKTSSTGIRLQLWKAALHLFDHHPVFGIGRENYESSIKEMADKKVVTEELTRLAHSHNELLFNMVISGIFGLFSILSLYLVPGYFFARELKHTSPEVRQAAISGCVLVICFFAFGLTDLMFFWPVLCGYYAMMVAVFLVSIMKAKQGE